MFKTNDLVTESTFMRQDTITLGIHQSKMDTTEISNTLLCANTK